MNVSFFMESGFWPLNAWCFVRCTCYHPSVINVSCLQRLFLKTVQKSYIAATFKVRWKKKNANKRFYLWLSLFFKNYFSYFCQNMDLDFASSNFPFFKCIVYVRCIKLAVILKQLTDNPHLKWHWLYKISMLENS